MGGAHCHVDAPGLREGRQELPLLLAQGVRDEQGQGIDAGGEVLQLRLQTADLFLQIFAPIIEFCD